MLGEYNVHSLFTRVNSIDTYRSFRSLLNFTPKQTRYIAIGLLLLMCSGIRIWFWYTTHLTFEDALITFRYAENIASGNGFVYNANERVLGTTTPLWTLILAGAKFAGADLFSASKMLGILLDAATCLLMIAIMSPLGRTHCSSLCNILCNLPCNYSCHNLRNGNISSPLRNVSHAPGIRAKKYILWNRSGAYNLNKN